MNTKHRKIIRIGKSAETRSHAAVKGALIWGTVYSTATTGAFYAVASSVDAEPLTLSHVLTDSMVMFYPFGAARGLLMWRAKNKRNHAGMDKKTVRWLNERLPRNTRSKAA